jgi:Leucine-rich repeat (LRR) protein
LPQAPVWLLGLILAAGLCAEDLSDREVRDWAAAQGGDAALDESGRLVDLYLGFTWTTDADLDRIERLSNIQRLDLSLTYITDEGMERLKALPGVTELNFFGAESITDVAVAHLRGWDRLQRLNLRGSDITDTSMEYIGSLKNLRSLDVSFTQVSTPGLEYLAELTELEELVLGGNKINGVGLTVLAALPNLKKLSLKGSQRRNSGYWAVSLTDVDMELLGSLAQLEWLDVGGSNRSPLNALSDLGIGKLAGLRELRVLDISQTRISSAGLRPLADLPKLERLSLWRAKRIDDRAAEHLARMRWLGTLDLSETNVTDATLGELVVLENLRRLYLSGTKVTPEAVERFRRERPDCEVSLP